MAFNQADEKGNLKTKIEEALTAAKAAAAAEGAPPQSPDEEGAAYLEATCDGITKWFAAMLPTLEVSVDVEPGTFTTAQGPVTGAATGTGVVE